MVGSEGRKSARVRKVRFLMSPMKDIVRSEGLMVLRLIGALLGSGGGGRSGLDVKGF